MSFNQGPDLLDRDIDSFIQPGCKVFRSQLPPQLPGSLNIDVRAHFIGSYANSLKGSWQRPSDEPMAVGIKLIKLPVSIMNDRLIMQRIIREAAIWAAVSHPNIFPFIGYQLADEGLMLVSPWCEQGNLLKYTLLHPGITRGEKIRLLRDAALGLSHLHCLNPPIAHGGIKPENVFVLDNLEAALCDYGISSVRLGLNDGWQAEVREDFSTVPTGYQAKEIIEGSIPTPASDVYAFGGLILHIMSGEQPFSAKRWSAAMFAILDNQTPAPRDHPKLPATDPLWSLLRDCWNGYPQSRPTISDVIFELEQELWREVRLPRPRLSEDHLAKPILSPSLPPSNEEESLVRPGYYVFARELPPPIRGTLTKTGELAFRGGSGDVYRGLWSPPDAKAISVVIKCVRPPDESQKDTFETRVKRETTIWSMVKHRNILPFIGYQIVNEVPMLVSPWCEKGNLATYIDANPELTRNDKLDLLRGAARGLVHLHTLKPPIYHGDIKPQNILVDDDLQAMLCDFGISRFILKAGDHSGFTTSDLCKGTSGYLAREILDEEKPTTAADVYAFSGLVLATMSGQPPFWKKGATAKVVAVVQGHMPEPADHPRLPKTDPLWDLMRECWSSEPGSRPHMTTLSSKLEALDHRPLSWWITVGRSLAWAFNVTTHR